MQPSKFRNPADLLKWSGVFWFSVASVGHALFAFYIFAYFGQRLVQNGLAGLADTHLQGGHIVNDAIGNIAVAVHIMIAVIVHGLGPLQFIPAIRKWAPRFHRWVGRAFVVAVTLASLSGLYIIWIRGTREGMVPDATNTLDAFLIAVFSIFAVRSAMARKIDEHRRWALRLFMAASAVWFVRLGIYGSILTTQLAEIQFRPIAQNVINAAHFAKLALPLGILELYLWAQRTNKNHVKLSAAAVVLIATLMTGFGIFAVATIGWLPKLLG